MDFLQRRWWLILPLAAGLVLAAFFLLNRGYGETSELGYRYATALYSACNQQDVSKLDRIGTMVDEAAARGELHHSEVVWLTRIIDQGRHGRWSVASKRVRRLMEDQLRRNPSPGI